MQARDHLLYPMSLVLYCLTARPPLPSRSPSGKFPKKRKKIFMILVAIAAASAAIIAAAVIIGLFSIQQQKQQNEGAPNVKFITFEVDKQEIAVGESTNILINVRNSEDKVIDDARIVMRIEPSGYEPYLSISNSTIELPMFFGKDARTGEIKVSITALGSPAKEAVYVVKGMVFVEKTLSDIREFRLTIRQ